MTRTRYCQALLIAAYLAGKAERGAKGQGKNLVGGLGVGGFGLGLGSVSNLGISSAVSVTPLRCCQCAQVNFLGGGFLGVTCPAFCRSRFRLFGPLRHFV